MKYLKKFVLMIAQLLFFSSVFSNIDPWDAGKNTWTPLMIYVYEGQFEKVDSMIKAGADIDGRNPRGYGALWVAIMKGDYKVTKLLLRNGASTNITDTSGQSVLIRACLSNRYRISKLLLQNGADVNYNIRGYTALMSATSFGCPRLLRLLIKYGADVNAMRKVNKTTPLNLARYGFYLGHIYKRKYRILKRYGAVE